MDEHQRNFCRKLNLDNVFSNHLNWRLSKLKDNVVSTDKGINIGSRICLVFAFVLQVLSALVTVIFCIMARFYTIKFKTFKVQGKYMSVKSFKRLSYMDSSVHMIVTHSLVWLMLWRMLPMKLVKKQKKLLIPFLKIKETIVDHMNWPVRYFWNRSDGPWFEPGNHRKCFVIFQHHLKLVSLANKTN